MLTHTTDMHVARRIDSFRVTLEASGRTEVASSAFADRLGRQHVGFRGVDHQLHEIRWS